MNYKYPEKTLDMRKLKCCAALFAAFAFAAVTVSAVTPTIIKKTDTRACERWVDSVYRSMSDRERVAQLVFPKVVPTRGADSRAVIKRLVSANGVGGLLFTEGTIDQYADMTDYAMSFARDGKGVAPLMTFDGEWGLSMRVKNTPRFPHNMGLGAVADPQLIYRYGAEMARECRLLGIQVNFAPVLDVNSNPSNPVIGYRSFGEDPVKVGRLGEFYSRGLEDGGVQAVGKHFPGHGDTGTDSHKTLPSLNHDLGRLEEVDLKPFKDFIDAGCSGIMTGHIALPALDPSGTPASLSKKISTELLRDKMGFEGLIYTDALGMKGATVEGRNNALMALEAGADVLLSPLNPVDDIDFIAAALKSGKLSRKTLEDRCRRVLTYKYALGLSKPVTIDTKGLAGAINSPEADMLNRELAAASMTVIYNRDDLLPIGNLDKTTIAVVNIGAPADNEFSATCSRYARVDRYYTNGAAFSAETLAKIKNHDVVIAAVYNDKSWARSTMASLKDCRNLVAVFMVNPYKMNKFAGSIGKAGALVLAYDDTPYTREYAAQALFGGIDVDGTLPVNLKGLAPIGTGVKLKKSRLGFSTPLAMGMRPSLTDSIDSIVGAALKANAFPGCQVLVARHGNVIHDKCYGLTTAGGAAVTPATVYDLASVSKATGTLPGVMKAYDLGLFSLDDKASKHIPGLRGTDKESVTVSQLLYHESGIRPALNMFEVMTDAASYTGDLIKGRPDAMHKRKVQNGAYVHNTARLRRDITSDTRSDRFPVTAAEGLYVGRETYDTIMGRIYHSPLRARKDYAYSCLNFCLLMDMEQRLTSQPHDRFVTDSIFAPIGAYTTCYRPTLHHNIGDIAPTEKDNYLRNQHLRGYVHDELANFSGGVQGNAGLFSNADDVAKICQMWLNGGVYGDRRVLSEETVRLFTTSKSPTCRRGLGFDKPDAEQPDNSPTCDEADPSVYGHLGFTGTVFWVDPVNDMIFVFLTNRVDPTRDNAAFSKANIRPELFRQLYKALDK